MFGYTFESWMEKVDYLMNKMYGVTSSDIDDYCYRDAFEDRVTPVVVARRAVKAAGFDNA